MMRARKFVWPQVFALRAQCGRDARVPSQSLNNSLPTRVTFKILISLVCALSSVGCARKPTGPLAYVTNERDGTISVIDLKKDRTVSTIKVGARPGGIQL